MQMVREKEMSYSLDLSRIMTKMTDLHMLAQSTMDFPDYPITDCNHYVFKNIENLAARVNSRSKVTSMLACTWL
jgi:hypothetical protein